MSAADLTSGEEVAIEDMPMEQREIFEEDLPADDGMDYSEPLEIMQPEDYFASYMHLVNFALFHAAAFPLGLILRLRNGFANELDKQFYVIAGSW